eukprot:3552110-Rhodomonas_salina.7
MTDAGPQSWYQHERGQYQTWRTGHVGADLSDQPVELLYFAWGTVRPINTGDDAARLCRSRTSETTRLSGTACTGMAMGSRAGPEKSDSPTAEVGSAVGGVVAAA